MRGGGGSVDRETGNNDATAGVKVVNVENC